MSSKPVKLEVYLLMLEGQTEEQGIATLKERARVREKAEKLLGKPIEEWPQFNLMWDDDPACYHFSQDGLRAGGLKDDDIGLTWVKLAHLDSVLQAFNLRTIDEVWSVGDPRKAARVIVHCSEGRKLSPVWVVPTTPGKVGLVGGNHRLAVARAKRVESLPIIFHEHDRAQLKPLFPELSDPLDD